MDFFEQQAKAHRQTKWLVVYFVMAVAAMIAAIYIAALLIFSGLELHHQHRYQSDYEGNNPQVSVWIGHIFFGVTIITLAIVGIGSAYKTMALSSGGSAVSEMMGGRLISTTTSNPDERKLLNVVEEMSIASGVAMPQVYVIDEEEGINAFAAGHKPADATVTVTRGCMRLLSRDELQGVIGHEFSHMLNGDMRLNLRIMGTIFGILCLAILGRILLQTSSGSREKNPLPLVGLALLIIGYIGVFFGRLIQAAVSRQREFLADASSVQFTRNPAGITGALKKIGGLGGMGSRLSHAHSEECSHMFFSNGVSEAFIGLLETHPPLEARIRVFEPTFDGNFPIVRYDDESATPEENFRPRPKSPPNIFGTVVGGAILAGGSEPPVIKPHIVLPNLGNPTPLHLKYAEQLRDSLPDSIRAAARDPLDATALIYAMLLDNEDNQRAQQLAGLEQRAGAAIRQKAAVLYPETSKAASHARLPIVNVALGALKQLTRDQYENFSKTLEWLINSDGKVELFEFVLRKIIQRNLDSQFHGATKPTVQYYGVKPLAPDCSVILSALANISSSNPAEIQKAFGTGAPYLRAPGDSDLELLPADQCGVNQIDSALNRLVLAAPIIKKNILEACVHVIGSDGVILETEAELLRAVSDTLDCPMPPLITN